MLSVRDEFVIGEWGGELAGRKVAVTLVEQLEQCMMYGVFVYATDDEPATSTFVMAPSGWHP